MCQSYIAMIIILIAAVLFASNKIPLYISTILVMLMMPLAGIITYDEAFSGFRSNAVFLIISLSILGQAFFTSGISQKLGEKLAVLANRNETVFIASLYVIGCILSAFFNGVIIVAIFIPVLKYIEHASGGRISQKNALFPLAVSTVIGANLSSIGSTSMINLSGMLAASSYGREIRFFEPLPAALPAIAAVLLFYIFAGTKLQRKHFDFKASEDYDRATVYTSGPVCKRKIVTVSIITVLCIGSIIVGFNITAVSFLTIALLIITKCIDEKEAFNSVSWPTICIVGASIGFAKGVEVSGAGTLITDTILSHCSIFSDSAYGMCILLLIISTILSNIMSNNATVTIMLPIALSFAATLGMDAMPYVLAVGIGTNLSVATPICVAPMTMISPLGYRFKDYILVGGIINLIAAFATAIALYMIYFM